jgi:alpha-mannosidase
MQLNNHMKELMDAIDKKTIDNYLLDAQSVLVEIYLKNNPRDEQRIKKLIKDNKVQIGP